MRGSALEMYAMRRVSPPSPTTGGVSSTSTLALTLTLMSVACSHLHQLRPVVWVCRRLHPTPKRRQNTPRCVCHCQCNHARALLNDPNLGIDSELVKQRCQYLSVARSLQANPGPDSYSTHARTRVSLTTIVTICFLFRSKAAQAWLSEIWRRGSWM